MCVCFGGWDKVGPKLDCPGLLAHLTTGFCTSWQLYMCRSQLISQELYMLSLIASSASIGAACRYNQLLLPLKNPCWEKGCASLSGVPGTPGRCSLGASADLTVSLGCRCQRGFAEWNRLPIPHIVVQRVAALHDCHSMSLAVHAVNITSAINL